MQKDNVITNSKLTGITSGIALKNLEELQAYYAAERK